MPQVVLPSFSPSIYPPLNTRFARNALRSQATRYIHRLVPSSSWQTAHPTHGVVCQQLGTASSRLPEQVNVGPCRNEVLGLVPDLDRAMYTQYGSRYHVFQSSHDHCHKHCAWGAACNVYVSEGRDCSVIQRLQDAAEQDKQVVLAHTFVDRPYNRTGFTLASAREDKLVEAAARLAGEALHAVDLRSHAATHPRLGTVDHILCSPLRSADVQAAARAGHAIAGRLAKGAPPVPVYLYGAAHPQWRRLAAIRRALGYFAGAGAGQWDGAGKPTGGALPLPPDLGPAAADASTGVCTVGAATLVVNFNLPLTGVGLEEARRIARTVSERGGGLPAVEAMALPHGEGAASRAGVEVACNLLDCSVTPPAAVEALVWRLARDAGGAVAGPYTTGRTEEELVAMVLARTEGNLG